MNFLSTELLNKFLYLIFQTCAWPIAPTHQSKSGSCWTANCDPHLETAARAW